MHIGKMIETHFRSMPKDYSIKWFAESLNCNRRNIYAIFNRTSIDTELLIRISKLLKHNFAQDIADQIFAEVSGPEACADTTRDNCL